MSCLRCSSVSVTKDGTTQLGRHRFRCRQLRRRFTRRSSSTFSGGAFADAIIVLAVRRCIRYRPSYLQVSEWLAERGNLSTRAPSTAGCNASCRSWEDSARKYPDLVGPRLACGRDLPPPDRAARLHLVERDLSTYESPAGLDDRIHTVTSHRPAGFQTGPGGREVAEHIVHIGQIAERQGGATLITSRIVGGEQLLERVDCDNVFAVPSHEIAQHRQGAHSDSGHRPRRRKGQQFVQPGPALRERAAELPDGEQCGRLPEGPVRIERLDPPAQGCSQVVVLALEVIEQ
jgi:hypothetical protein